MNIFCQWWPAAICKKAKKINIPERRAVRFRVGKVMKDDDRAAAKIIVGQKHGIKRIPL